VTLQWDTSEPKSHVEAAKFLPLLRQAVAVAPHRPELKLELARALFQSDQMVELIDLLKPSLTDQAAAPQLLYWLGRAAIARRDDALALVAFRSAAARGLGSAHDFLPKVLARLGRDDEALDAGLEALKRVPAKREALRAVATVLCKRGEVERLWRLCIDLRTRGEQGRLLAAVMSSAAAMLNNRYEFEKLMDRSKWFFADRLAVPEDFNRSLAAEILAEESGRPMQGIAIRGAGWRVDHLERLAGPYTRDLMDRIRAAVGNYVAERENFSSDPVMRSCPPTVTINSWSLAARDDGHTAWHIHPRAWISGVYYVQVPELKPASPDLSGAIEFGPFPLSDGTEALKPYRWRVMPEPGLLLLFPSHYAHRSIPTGVDAPRISVAVDVQPLNSDAVAAEQQN
jgi:tetratricopeptide (TPR) repeat protein